MVQLKEVLLNFKFPQDGHSSEIKIQYFPCVLDQFKILFTKHQLEE